MDFDTLQPAAIDLNGQFRGKRVLGDQMGKIAKGALRMPLSALNVDITGADIEGSPLVFESGDQDGLLKPTARGPVPMPWLASNTALVPLTMWQGESTPFDGDPVHALDRVLAPIEARGWEVMTGAELEFTLVDDRGGALTPPLVPGTDRRIGAGEVLGTAPIDAFDRFFKDITEGAAAMGIPIASITSESGLGQFEVTLDPCPARQTCENILLFKALARGTARNHGSAATFMAKPYPDDAGNGLHLHVSVVGPEGNVFDDRGDEGTDLLRQGVAGVLESMSDATLIFAPHANSYARFVAGNHAPLGALWGYDNRTVAVRIPYGSPKTRRFEHRVAGGDTNPYLIMAAILGGMMRGIEAKMTPPAHVTGNAYDVEAPQLAATWADAIERFESSEAMAAIFSEGLRDNFLRTKKQELALFAARTQPDWQLLLETV